MNSGLDHLYEQNEAINYPTEFFERFNKDIEDSGSHKVAHLNLNPSKLLF